MISRIKENIEEFSLLPNAVKYAIYFVIGLILAIAVFQTLSHQAANKKLESLERANQELTLKSAKAEERAKIAESAFAAESLRAKNLESKIKPIEQEIKKSEQKISRQSQKSTDIRQRLNRVRVSKPANTSTERLERRLQNRYNQTNRSQ